MLYDIIEDENSTNLFYTKGLQSQIGYEFTLRIPYGIHNDKALKLTKYYIDLFLYKMNGKDLNSIFYIEDFYYPSDEKKGKILNIRCRFGKTFRRENIEYMKLEILYGHDDFDVSQVKIPSIKL